MEKKILGVITARGGSKGLPGKNIKILGDKPLISYTIEVAKKSHLLTHLIVSTDDQEIADVCKKYGANVPFMRPKELAEDKTPHLPVMQHATKFMEEKEGIVFDYVVVLQPTSPFRSVEDLDGTIKKAIEHNADSSVSLVEVQSTGHPIKMKKLENDRVIEYFLKEEEGIRRQDLPIAYKRSCAVYVTKRDVLMDKNRLYGDYVVGHIVAQERSIDINYPIDWVIAEYMLEELKKKGSV